MRDVQCLCQWQPADGIDGLLKGIHGLDCNCKLQKVKNRRLPRIRRKMRRMVTTSKQPARSATTRTFGDRLLEAASDKGAPTEQERLAKWFADIYGIKTSGAMLNKYRNIDAAPRINKCREFAVALGVAVEWLYTERGPKHPGPVLEKPENEVLDALRQIDDIGARTDWYGYIKIAVPRGRPPRPGP